MNDSNKKPANIIEEIEAEFVKKEIPDFRVGDTIRVHAKITEGNRERIQVFEGTVIKRNKKNLPTATFTVRKVSYNVGVERTFLLYSPLIDKIEVVSKGRVRRARLFYLRSRRGKSARIKSILPGHGKSPQSEKQNSQSSENSNGEKPEPVTDTKKMVQEGAAA